MSYRVNIDVYQGPFDLLLQLVSRQKVDIGAISISQIADQYLEQVERMEDLDLDVASDFIVVAASLLQLKAASLLEGGTPEDDLDDEFAGLSPEETRDILVARLVTYKQFKNAAAALSSRMEAEGRMHPRECGPGAEFMGLMPDYLKGMTLHGLAVICANIAARRETFLLESEHIAAAPISMERYVEGIYRSMRSRQHQAFSDLVGKDASPELVVVSFMAILELYKRGVISIEQTSAFADIELAMEPDAAEIEDFSVPDWGIAEESEM